MTQRTALIISAVLAAFVLVLVGGVAARAVQPETAAATPATVSDPADTIAILQQREAAYRNLIDQANARLQEANARLQQVNQQQSQAGQVAQTQTRSAAASAVAPTYAVSSNQAASIALAAVPGAKLTRAPELVLFQGKAAYEVVLDRGKVYVDANSGQVLYNGAAAATSPAPTGGGEHEGGEHEGGEHDGGEREG
jgi:uncharacterized membrane protein YkoI